MKYNRLIREALYFIYNPPKGSKTTSKTLEYILNVYKSIVFYNDWGFANINSLTFEDYKVNDSLNFLICTKGEIVFCYALGQKLTLTISNFRSEEIIGSKCILIDFEEVMFINNLANT